MSERAKSQSGINLEEEFQPDAAVVEFIENWKTEFWKNAPVEETGLRPLPDLKRSTPVREASSAF